MNIMTRPSAYPLTFACLVLATSPAAAEERATQPAGTSAIKLEAQADTGIFRAQAVSEATLHTIAGREDTTQVSKAELAAGVSQNSVGDNSITGSAKIDGNAFQNMSGLSILNVNTGNNVAINAAMNVNISISPAP
jgi:hypothetical protein